MRSAAGEALHDGAGRSGRLPTGARSCAVWSFMLALARAGLGSAWTTLHLPKEREAVDCSASLRPVHPGRPLPVAAPRGAPTSRPASRIRPSSSSTGTSGRRRRAYVGGVTLDSPSTDCSPPPRAGAQRPRPRAPVRARCCEAYRDRHAGAVGVEHRIGTGWSSPTPEGASGAWPTSQPATSSSRFCAPRRSAPSGRATHGRLGAGGGAVDGDVPERPLPRGVPGARGSCGCTGTDADGLDARPPRRCARRLILAGGLELQCSPCGLRPRQRWTTMHLHHESREGRRSCRRLLRRLDPGGPLPRSPATRAAPTRARYRRGSPSTGRPLGRVAARPIRTGSDSRCQSAGREPSAGRRRLRRRTVQ